MMGIFEGERMESQSNGQTTKEEFMVGNSDSGASGCDSVVPAQTGVGSSEDPTALQHYVAAQAQHISCPTEVIQLIVKMNCSFC